MELILHEWEGKIFTRRNFYRATSSLGKMFSAGTVPSPGRERRCGKNFLRTLLLASNTAASFFKKRGWPRNTTEKKEKKRRRKKIYPERKLLFIHFFLAICPHCWKSKGENDPSRVSIIHRRIEFLNRHIRSFTASCLGHKRRRKAVKHFLTFQSIRSILRTTSIDPRPPMNRRDIT